MSARRMRCHGPLLVLLMLPLGGCTQTFSRTLVVESTSPVQDASQEDALAPAAVVPASDPALRAGPSALCRAARTWRVYEGREQPTHAERSALRQRACLVRARRKANWFTAAVVTGMAAYGAAVFGAGSSGFHRVDDGWFGEFTGSGGADKLGHAVSAHIQTAVYAAVFRHWGLPRNEAALRGAAAAFSAQLALEVADGFSQDHGFSWNDVIANAAGSVFGYFHETSPDFARVLDFRWQYWPSAQVRSGEDSEITTDYEGSAYLLAANLGAIYSRRANALDFLDVQLGYQTRYYSDRRARSERLPFIGIGLNLSAVCRRLRLRGLSRIFEYYQPPGISLRWYKNLNE